MQDERTDSSFRGRLVAFPSGGFVGLSLCACLLAGACNKPPAVNPWRDDSISPMVWTTPSEQGIFEEGHQPVIRQRPVSCSQAPLVSGDVPHYPLWWEDPFEDKGDEDGKFAWTWMDYFAGAYSMARFDLNTLAVPLSAIVTPPCTPMVSDGLVAPGRQHDAERGVSPNPSATLLDFGYEDENEEGQTPPSSQPNPPPATAPSA
jgi:hypothetical protein